MNNDAEAPTCGYPSDYEEEEGDLDPPDDPLPEDQWLPVTLENLPPPPPVRNIDRSKGPIVRIRVFGFPVLWSELVIMARKLGYPDPKGQCTDVWYALMRKASPWCNRYSIVKVGDHTSMCLVLGSSKTEEDMAGAMNLEAIEAIRRVIGLGRMPDWYRIRPS